MPYSQLSVKSCKVLCTGLQLIRPLTLATILLSKQALGALPFIAELNDQMPEFEGQVLSIVGGSATAIKLEENSPLVTDNILLVRVGDAQPNWAWRRTGQLGVDFNVDSAPIELSWLSIESGDDISPILQTLRENWGNTLIWRPAPTDVTASFVNWGQMNVFKMKSPTRDITIRNIPGSDAGHAATTGPTGQTVSLHRMWHFPVPPIQLQIGEERAEYQATFQDASFDADQPWRWTHGAKWAVQRGGCQNPRFEESATDDKHESFYRNIRWFSRSGLISIDVPARTGSVADATFQMGFHSNFSHTWGNAIFVQSIPLTTAADSDLDDGWSFQRAGNALLDIQISGNYFDAGIEFRAHGTANPINDLWLKGVTVSDPYSLGTAYPGSGSPTSLIDGDCSSIASPGLRLGVRGKARGSVHFEYGAASLSGFLLRSLHGDEPEQPMVIEYFNTGYTESSMLPSWDARRCCIPKIDGFTASNSGPTEPIRVQINVEGKFKSGRIHTPLAIEWGDDDATGVGISREVYADMNNAMLAFVPAPPLIPPTHKPETQSSRVHVKTRHNTTAIAGNPWATFYSNMTLLEDSELPYGLTLKGAMDEVVPGNTSESNPGQAFIAESFSIRYHDNIHHNTAGDAPAKIRLGLNNWAPPKYSWFKGSIDFENVAANGEFIYHPAWGNYRWTLRIDKTLPEGVRIKLGKAQAFSGRNINNATWHRGQIAQVQQSSDGSSAFYLALQDNIPAGSSPNDRELWQKIDNPFDSMTLIYKGETYQLPRTGAIVGADGELSFR